MAKDFKKNISQGSDKFFSANDEEPQRTQGTQRTQDTLNTKRKRVKP